MHSSEILYDLEDEINVFAKPFPKQLYVSRSFQLHSSNVYFKKGTNSYLGMGC